LIAIVYAAAQDGSCEKEVYMNNPRQLTVTGFAPCRFGEIIHQHDADESRANRLSNGGVYCVFCGQRGPSTFDALLGSGRGRLVRVDSRLDHRYSTTLGPQAWASLVFEDPKQFDDATEIGADFGSDYVTPAAEAKLPECIDKVARALANIGYRVTGAPATNTIGTLIMVLGREVKGTNDVKGVETPYSFVTGVKIELSWLY